MNVSAPGIYPEIASADYFADPCPAPSLTQSVAKILVDRSPLHAWHAHPRLNPDYREDDDIKYDIGNIAHALLIGRGKELVVLEYDDWRTKAAKEARSEALAAGRHAVLGKHVAVADKMVRSAREQLSLCGLTRLFEPGCGQGEVMLAWREGDVWLRSLVDWLDMTYSGPLIADYKTTALSCAPQEIAERPSVMGWDVQAAMHERAMNALQPDKAGRCLFIYIVQEDSPPYALTPVVISEADLTMGRKKIEAAIGIWRECMTTGVWPGYAREIVYSRPRAWLEAQWLEREVEQEERRSRRIARENVNLIMAG